MRETVCAYVCERESLCVCVCMFVLFAMAEEARWESESACERKREREENEAVASEGVCQVGFPKRQRRFRLGGVVCVRHLLGKSLASAWGCFAPA